jgi:hypothetical protein
MGTDATTDRLVGRRSYLRRLTPADYEFVYHMETTGDLALRWRHRGSTPSPEAAMRSLWEGTTAVMLACSKEHQAPYGLLVCYDSRFPGATARFAVAAIPQARRTGVVLEATTLFIQYCFDNWGYRKLYVDVPEYNLEQFHSALGRHFHEEGHLVDHDYWQGRHWGLLTFALYRTEWEQNVKMDRFLAGER